MCFTSAIVLLSRLLSVSFNPSVWFFCTAYRKTLDFLYRYVLVWNLSESWPFHVNYLIFQVAETSGSPADFIQRRKCMCVCPTSSLQRASVHSVFWKSPRNKQLETNFSLVVPSFFYSQYLTPKQSFSPPWAYYKQLCWFYPCCFLPHPARKNCCFSYS